MTPLQPHESSGPQLPPELLEDALKASGDPPPPTTGIRVGTVWGYADAGPLTITAGPGVESYVHIGWGDGGMYVTAAIARRLARMLLWAAEEVE